MQAAVDPSACTFIINAMRIGLISDIHGDLKALDRALMLLENRADMIWCAGDLVGRGRHPNEVVEKIVGAGIPTVLGNHDEIALTRGYYYSTDEDMFRECQPRTLRLLLTLPRTYRARIGGRTVVMVHGTPRSNAESMNLMPAYRERALHWLNKIGADILITGHTHVPISTYGSRGLIVNPGSLFDPAGSPRSSSETYGVLDTSALTFSYYPLWD
ncbi:MAG: metallophosphoesterase family protein [Anaerolineae bacterium]|nr:MAG: metallophosphoesterase family protein [Anaerolineae bacterium]